MTYFGESQALQNYVVPAGVQYVKVTAVGASGVAWANADSYQNGARAGRGASVTSVHKVTPGETLSVSVGQMATRLSNGQTYPRQGRTFGGGGGQTMYDDYQGANPGGGASDVRRGGTGLANRIVVAGGGGGSGWDENGVDAWNGHDAGPANATSWPNGATPFAQYDGGDGTQAAGGAVNPNTGNTYANLGQAGALGLGGNCVVMGTGSGGGGGGYYGGASGNALDYAPGMRPAGAGGGGSSRVISGALIATAYGDAVPSYQGGRVDIDPYVTSTPTVTFPVSPASAGRFAMRVDIKELHASPTGMRTVTYELSRYADFVVPGGGTPNITKTVNFTKGGADGKTAEDAVLAAPSDTSINYMDFWITLTAGGQWYWRVRTGGTESLPNSAYATGNFMSAHTPGVTIVSPTGAAFIEYGATTPFRINATDPWLQDVITAYQIIVERNDTGQSILDTGKTALDPDLALGQQTISRAIPNTAKDITLRWRVRIWDSTDTASNYSEYSLFTLVDKPAVTIISPTDGGTADTGAPTFQWSVGLTSGRTVASSKVTVRESQTNVLVWSRTNNNAVLSATPETTVLVNQVGYSVTVEVTDSVGLVGIDANLFTTSYVSPDPILYTVDASAINHPDGGYTEINWSNQSADPRLVAWRVYRRTLPDSTWELIAEIPDEGVKFYRDYLVQSGKNYMWTVTQLADRSGAILESPVGIRAFTPTVPTRRNLATNPKFTSLSGWTGTNAVLTAEAESGDTSLKIVPNGASLDSSARIGSGTVIPFGMQAGQTYTLSAEAFLPAVHAGPLHGNRGRKIVVHYSTNGGGAFTEVRGEEIANTAGNRKRVSVTVTLPAGTTGVIVQLSNGSQTAGDVIYWDDLLIESGNAVGSYFDGSFGATAGMGTRWLGTVNDSASELYQVANSAESQIENMAINNYWIICPDYPELTMLIPNCTSGGWSEVFEEATYTIVGRGRHRDYGDRLGYEGTLTSQIRQPERRSRVVERAQELRRAQENYWLRDPFGRLIQVALGDLSFDPEAGTGPMEMGELQIPWVEVA